MAKKRNKSKKNQSDKDVSSDDYNMFINALENINDDEIESKMAAEDSLWESGDKPQKTKSQRTSERKIDLHGMTEEQALSLLERELSELMARGDLTIVRIITGKGRHSADGAGVLVKGVYPALKAKFGQSFTFIDSDPGQDLINGMPIRGYFRVKLK